MTKLSAEQQEEVTKLEQWFTQHLAELKEREAVILKEYEAKKVALLKQRMNKSN